MRVRSMNPFPSAEAKALPAVSPPEAAAPGGSGGILGMLENMKKDDYILLGIIAALVFEGCDDYILLAALAYLYIMGIM